MTRSHEVPAWTGASTADDLARQAADRAAYAARQAYLVEHGVDRLPGEGTVPGQPADLPGVVQ